MLALALLMAACAAPTEGGPTGPSGLTGDAHIPPFARWPYQPFSREAAVQIAYRDGALSVSRSSIRAPSCPTTMSAPRVVAEGRRVLVVSLPAGEREQGFTGMHDQNGRVLRPRKTAILRGRRHLSITLCEWRERGAAFLSPTHSDYINTARQSSGWVITALHPRPTRRNAVT
jgi:hypothetical protein